MAFADSTREYRFALAFTPLTESLKIQFLRLCEALHNRKNWLFSDSVAGVRASANLYSLIETAKANGLEPYAYLRNVYEQLPQADTVAGIEGLLPWQWRTP